MWVWRMTEVVPSYEPGKDQSIRQDRNVRRRSMQRRGCHRFGGAILEGWWLQIEPLLGRQGVCDGFLQLAPLVENKLRQPITRVYGVRRG